jgi:hypothetical protein
MEGVSSVNFDGVCTEQSLSEKVLFHMNHHNLDFDMTRLFNYFSRYSVIPKSSGRPDGHRPML